MEMRSPSADSTAWLDLSEAAGFLGVHFTTLRRWADAGQVPFIRTPGGRRRFLRADLERFLADIRHGGSGTALAPLAERTLDRTHRNVQDLAIQQSGWMAHMNEDVRLHFRNTGKRMLGLLMQYNSRTDTGGAFLEEAQRLCEDYGKLCSRSGLSVTETIHAFLFFRRTILDSIYETGSVTGPGDAEALRLFQRTGSFLDALLLATVESYTLENQSPSQIRE